MASRTIAAPEPPTLVELQQQLAQLHAERIGLGKLLDTIPEREAEALEADASDAEFQKIDIDRRRAHHRLQKINLRHIELDAMILDARAVEDAKKWATYVDRYEVLALRMLNAANAVAVERDALVDLTNEAQREGFSMYAAHGAHLPYPPDVNVQAVARGVAAFATPLRQNKFNLRIEPIYVVEFLEWTTHAIGSNGMRTTAYLRGQQAGFTAAECWEFVAKQLAVFID